MDSFVSNKFHSNYFAHEEEKLAHETRLFFARRALELYNGWTSQVEDALNRVFQITQQQVKNLKMTLNSIEAEGYEEEVEAKESEVGKCPFPELLAGLKVRPAVPESEMQEANKVRKKFGLPRGNGGVQVCYILAWTDVSEAVSGTGVIIDVAQADGGIVILTAAHVACKFHPEIPQTYENARIIIPYHDEDWNCVRISNHDITAKDIHVHPDYRLSPTDVDGYDLCVMVLRDPPTEFMDLCRNKIQVPLNGDFSKISVAGYIRDDGVPRFSEAAGFEIWPKSQGHSLLYYDNKTNQGMSGGPVYNKSSVIGVHVAQNRASAITNDALAWIERVAQQPKKFSPRTDEDLNSAVREWCKDKTIGEQKFGHISNWDVSLITSMKNLFRDRSSFNEDISNWDVSAVVTMENMFYGATNFDQDLSKWDVSSVQNMSSMFRNSAFNHDINQWDVSSVETMADMFRDTPFFDQELGAWEVKSVVDMSRMFYKAKSFNQNLNEWDVTSVLGMARMFSNTAVFNQNLNKWSVSANTKVDSMFSGAEAFDQDISIWDSWLVDTVEMQQMSVFRPENHEELKIAVDTWCEDDSKGEQRYGTIGSWDVSLVTDMSKIFFGKKSI